MTPAAIVIGAHGRLGRAFVSRLTRDGHLVESVDLGDRRRPDCGTRPYLFELSYLHGEPHQHVAQVAAHLSDWRRYRAIFVPSSLWIVEDSPYGRAKREIEALATLHRGQGARIVIDRIGYFPGDGIAPDTTEPFHAHYVTGDALYARVMKRMSRSSHAPGGPLFVRLPDRLDAPVASTFATITDEKACEASPRSP